MNYKKIIIDYLYERECGMCQICRQPIALEALCEIDHIIEKKNGGADKLYNLRIVHLECHKKRHGVRGVVIHPRIVIKKDYHRMVLNSIRSALLKQPVLMRSCKEIGMSERMCRYYMTKYHLDPKEVQHWDFNNL